MQWKAIMLDLDGTTIPNHPDGMPSARVTQAIRKAHPLLHVGIVTARPYPSVKNIASHLQISGPSILNGGGRVMNLSPLKVLWEQSINSAHVKAVYEIVKDYPTLYDEGDGGILLAEDSFSEKALNFFVQAVPPEKVAQMEKELSLIPTLKIHTVPSWEKGKIAILINHVNATKQHGIFEVAKILGIETQEIIGVGDGGNDFPLLMACGLKVAMGNASDSLKAIADYIAPPVDEDGVADVIEKFVLNP